MMKMVDDRAREIQILKSIIFFLLEDNLKARNSGKNYLDIDFELVATETKNKDLRYNIRVGNDKFIILSHRFYDIKPEKKDSKKKKSLPSQK